MSVRAAHGRAAGLGSGPRVEVLPADELPGGVPAPAQSESPGDRHPGGKFAPGNSLARVGGQARKGQTRLAARLSLASVTASAPFAPYKASAVSFRRAQCAALAATVGGGVCGAGPSSIVASAALQLAWSRFFSDRASATGSVEDAVLASRMANDSRQNLLAAHELCAREALARGPAREPDLAKLNQAAEEETAKRREASRQALVNGGAK